MEKQSKFESTMDKVGLWIDQYIAPPLVKLGNEPHMAAIRAALIRTIPLIIVGSIPLILTNLPVKSWAEFMAAYADKLNVLNNMSFGFISLWLAISLGYELAKIYEELDPIMCSVIVVCCFLITVEPMNLELNTIGTTGLSSKGMFTLFVIAILVIEFMHFAYKHNIVIRMPKSVPPNISQSFASLLPMAILLIFFWVFRVVIGFDLTSLINTIISPLLSVTDTWYAAFICVLLLQLLWFVGIHGGSFTIWGVMYPFLLANVTDNAIALAAGQPMQHILTEPFFYSWTMIGGTGSTLPLIFFWWKSRSSTLREVSRVSLVPGIFCINEPVMFGAPIVLNPIMFIPFVFFTSLFGTMYGYILTAMGWISPAYVQIPWTTPPLLQPFLSTGDWRNVVAQAILIVLLCIIWYPFAKLWEKKMVEQEAELE